MFLETILSMKHATRISILRLKKTELAGTLNHSNIKQLNFFPKNL